MKRTAFTLIELLVVVAIITMLIAILLPSLHRARDAAKRTVCASHLDQIVTASITYATASRGVLPPREGPNISGVPHHLFAGNPATSGDTNRDLLEAWEGYLGGFNATPGEEDLTPIWYCPSAPDLGDTDAYEWNKRYQYPNNNFLIGYQYLGGFNSTRAGVVWAGARPAARRLTAAGRTPIVTDITADLVAVFGEFSKNHVSPLGSAPAAAPEGTNAGRLDGSASWVDYHPDAFEIVVTWSWYPPNQGIVWPIN